MGTAGASRGMLRRNYRSMDTKTHLLKDTHTQTQKKLCMWMSINGLPVRWKKLQEKKRTEKWRRRRQLIYGSLCKIWMWWPRLHVAGLCVNAYFMKTGKKFDKGKSRQEETKSGKRRVLFRSALGCQQVPALIRQGCVCAWKRERERETKKRGRERQECVLACVENCASAYVSVLKCVVNWTRKQCTQRAEWGPLSLTYTLSARLLS